MLKNASTYCLKIQILDSEPRIWRRFCIDALLPIRQLHSTLARVMGWSGEAVYRFKFSRQDGGNTLEVSADEAETIALTLQDVIAHGGDSFFYTYDLSRGWVHTVTLETTEIPELPLPVPCCLAGDQACPPEFCVGVWGYEDLLDRLSDPDDPEYDQLWEQVGYDFDPAAFNLDAVNQRLRELR